MIFLGSSDGAIVVFSTKTKLLLNRIKVVGAGAIHQLAVDPRGRYLASSSADRNVRLFGVGQVLEAGLNSENVEAVGKMSDAITRTRWTSLMFSGDGELILGGALRFLHSASQFSETLTRGSRLYDSRRAQGVRVGRSSLGAVRADSGKRERTARGHGCELRTPTTIL